MSNVQYYTLTKIGFTKRTDPTYGNNYYYNMMNKIKVIEPSGLKDGKSQYYIKFINEGLIFSIRRFYKLNGRTHVIVYCNEIESGGFTRHEYYTSKSDLFFFRYCVSSGSMYYKGLNYVTSTFINIELQKFLDLKKHNFHIHEDADARISNCVNIDSITDVTLKNRITSESATSSHNFFRIMSELFPHVDSYTDYKTTLLNVIEQLKISTNAEDVDRTNLISDLYCCLKKRSVNGQIRGSRTEYFTTLRQAFEDMFEKYFSVVLNSETRNPEINVLHARNVVLGTKDIGIYICSTTIRSLNPIREYKLYYIYYALDGKTYKNILCIVPSDTVMTKYGLDSRYVSAGLFINKSFDYKEQALISFVRSGARGDIERGTDYIHIGEFTNYRFLPTPTIDEIKNIVARTIAEIS